MNGATLLLINLAIFTAAVAGIIVFSLLALRFAGMAMNGARARQSRAMSGVFAALCAGGIAASAAAGFLGITLVLYTAQQ